MKRREKEPKNRSSPHQFLGGETKRGGREDEYQMHAFFLPKHHLPHPAPPHHLPPALVTRSHLRHDRMWSWGKVDANHDSSLIHPGWVLQSVYFAPAKFFHPQHHSAAHPSILPLLLILFSSAPRALFDSSNLHLSVVQTAVFCLGSKGYIRKTGHPYHHCQEQFSSH